MRMDQVRPSHKAGEGEIVPGLSLTRKPGECLIIDRKIVLQILAIHGDEVRIKVNADKAISVSREEVHKCTLECSHFDLRNLE